MQSLGARACQKCGETKDPDEYPKLRSRICAECQGKSKAESGKLLRNLRTASGESAAYSREWRKRNPGKAAGYVRKWQSKNPTAYHDYMQENRWVQRVYNARRRAAQASARLDPFTTKDLLAAWHRADVDIDRCLYCDSASTGMDHIVPFSRGGAHVIENCVPACGKCNSSKHDFLLESWVDMPNMRRPLYLDVLERVYAYQQVVSACAS